MRDPRLPTVAPSEVTEIVFFASHVVEDTDAKIRGTTPTTSARTCRARYVLIFHETDRSKRLDAELERLDRKADELVAW